MDEARKLLTDIDKIIQTRMSLHVSDDLDESEKLNVSLEEAKKIQKNYFHEYNTTLNGMIKNHEIDATSF